MRKNGVIVGRLVLAAAILAAGVVAGAMWFNRGQSGVGWWGVLAPKAVDEKVTLSILKSEAMSFLVTRRVTTQIVVDHSESDWLGDWQGVLWATVSWRWGADLSKLTEKDIRRDGNTVICRLPEPQLLDFGVEPGSERFLSKSTAIPKLAEMFRPGQQQLLQQQLRIQAMKFADEQKLRPSRDEMVRQLNATTAALRQASGLDLQFE